jgi:hypothetical protein
MPIEMPRLDSKSFEDLNLFISEKKKKKKKKEQQKVFEEELITTIYNITLQ